MKSRIISLVIFFYGLFAVIGADSFQDYYLEMQSKFSDKVIDYGSISDFCGWTGEPNPWETEFEYRLRSARNMAGALAAMFIFASTVITLFIVLIGSIFYLFGGFK